MLIYNGLKTDFMADTENDVLEKKLYDAIKNKMLQPQDKKLLVSKQIKPKNKQKNFVVFFHKYS